MMSPGRVPVFGQASEPQWANGARVLAKGPGLLLSGRQSLGAPGWW
jgi:hypothetical protein